MSKETGLTGKHPESGQPMRLMVCFSTGKKPEQIGFESQVQGQDGAWVALEVLDPSARRAVRHFMTYVDEPTSPWWECRCENEWEKLHHSDWKACPQCGTLKTDFLPSHDLLGKYGPFGNQSDNWALIDHTVYPKEGPASTFHSNMYLPDVARSLSPIQMGKFVAEYVAHIGGSGLSNGLAIGAALKDMHRATYAVAVTMLVAILEKMNESDFVDGRNKAQKAILTQICDAVRRM